MTKQTIPLMAEDISEFSKSLAAQLENPPTHLTLMNMLARAAGFRNFQHLRAAHMAGGRLAEPPAPMADNKTVEKALRQFDEKGRWIKWPAKRKMQEICLWVMWSRIPPKRVLEERDVNGLLNHAHLFDDTAILRRSMIGMKLMTRNRDGSDYQRIEQQPPAEAVALIGQLAQRLQPA